MAKVIFLPSFLESWWRQANFRMAGSLENNLDGAGTEPGTFWYQANTCEPLGHYHFLLICRHQWVLWCLCHQHFVMWRQVCVCRLRWHFILAWATTLLLLQIWKVFNPAEDTPSDKVRTRQKMAQTRKASATVACTVKDRWVACSVHVLHHHY